MYSNFILSSVMIGKEVYREAKLSKGPFGRAPIQLSAAPAPALHHFHSGCSPVRIKGVWWGFSVGSRSQIWRRSIVILLPRCPCQQRRSKGRGVGGGGREGRAGGRGAAEEVAALRRRA